MTETPDDTLDLRGLKCPLPAMLARKALTRLAPGMVLTVLADDPMALVDVPHMCHREGHTLKGTTRAVSHAAFRIEAGAIRPAEEEVPAAAPDAADRAAPHRDPDA